LSPVPLKLWKSLFSRKFTLGAVLLVVGIILMLISLSIFLLFGFDTEGGRYSTFNAVVTAFSIGLVLIITGPLIISSSYFFKNKLSREYDLKELVLVLGEVIAYDDIANHIINTFRSYGIPVQSRYKKIFLNVPSTEIVLIGQNLTVTVHPKFQGGGRYTSPSLVGVIVSIGPNANISNPGVQKIISIIEGSLSYRSTQQYLSSF
jgi:hypothetical protein